MGHILSNFTLFGGSRERRAIFSALKVSQSVLATQVISDSATPWTVARQVSLSVGFSRQQCWSGLPFPSPRDLPNPGIKPEAPELQADSSPSDPPAKPALKVMVL